MVCAAARQTPKDHTAPRSGERHGPRGRSADGHTPPGDDGGGGLPDEQREEERGEGQLAGRAPHRTRVPSANTQAGHVDGGQRPEAAGGHEQPAQRVLEDEGGDGQPEDGRGPDREHPGQGRAASAPARPAPPATRTAQTCRPRADRGCARSRTVSESPTRPLATAVTSTMSAVDEREGGEAGGAEEAGGGDLEHESGERLGHLPGHGPARRAPQQAQQSRPTPVMHRSSQREAAAPVRDGTGRHPFRGVRRAGGPPEGVDGRIRRRG